MTLDSDQILPVDSISVLCGGTYTWYYCFKEGTSFKNKSFFTLPPDIAECDLKPVMKLIHIMSSTILNVTDIAPKFM